MVVLLDYGHGKDTEGKSFADFDEWEFNRAIGDHLELELQKRHIEYKILVKEDEDIGLRTRIERAKTIPHDLLVSIHGNSFEDDLSVGGIETFYYRKESEEVADLFQKHLLHRLKWRDRGVKKANFYIIKNAPKKAVLTESGFYTNEAERILMKDPFWRLQIAIAHADAIREYFTSCEKI